MFGRKSKKTLKSTPKNLLFGIPANIAAGPLGFRAELDVESEGGWICSYRYSRQDRPDSTLILDENNPRPSRIAFGEKQSGVEGHSVPGTQASAVAVDDVVSGERPTGGSSKPDTTATDLHVDLCAIAQ